MNGRALVTVANADGPDAGVFAGSDIDGGVTDKPGIIFVTLKVVDYFMYTFRLRFWLGHMIHTDNHIDKRSQPV